MRAGAVQHGDTKGRPPGVKLCRPLAQDGGRADDDGGAEAAPPAARHRGARVGERGKEGDHLDGLAQAHLVAWRRKEIWDG